MTSDTSLDKLEKLHRLKEKGYLTEDEYLEQKQQILAISVELINPTPPTIVPSGYVWALAFAPLFGDLIEQITAETLNLESERLFIITIGLNIILGFLDSHEMEKAGHQTALLDACWLVPAYLYERGRVLNEFPTYLLTWLMSFGIVLFMAYN